jgi:hypothetical protein
MIIRTGTRERDAPFQISSVSCSDCRCTIRWQTCSCAAATAQTHKRGDRHPRKPSRHGRARPDIRCWIVLLHRPRLLTFYEFARAAFNNVTVPIRGMRGIR